MTTLSLFDEPSTLDSRLPEAERPERPERSGDPGDSGGAEQSGGTALDPDAVRELLPTVRPARAGGLTLPVLAFAALIASPAIWQCLVRHAVPIHVMLERYVVIAIGCLLVSEAARRLLPQVSPDEGGDEAAGTVEEPGASLGGESAHGVGGDLAAAGAGPIDPALTLLAAER